MTTTVDNYKLRVSQTGAKATAAAMNKLKSSVVGLALSYVGIHGLTAVVKGSVLAFAKQEQAEKRLASVTKGFTKDLIAQAAAIQQVSVYGDEMVMDAQRMLMQLGGTRENIEKATEATVELASSLGMDLKSASRLVGQALSGNVQTLARYIPAVRNLTKEEIESGKAIDLVIRKLGGSAAAEADTLTGAMAQADNAAGDLAETLGERIAPAALFAAKSIKMLSEAAQAMADESGIEKVAQLVVAAGGMGQLVSAAMTGDLESVFAKRLAGQIRMRQKAGQPVAPAGAASEATLAALSGGKFEGSRVADELARAIELGIQKSAATMDRTAADPLRFEGQSNFSQMIDFFKGGAGQAGDMASDVIESAREFASGLDLAIDDVFADGQQARTDNWIAATKFRLDTEYEMLLEQNALKQQLYKADVEMVRNAAVGVSMMLGQTFAAALAGQEDIGKKFLKGILSLLGDLAIARGNVAVGVAFAETYQSFGASLQQAAPGLALIALGTALKAGSSAIGGKGGGGRSGYGAGYSPYAGQGGGGQRSVVINVNSGIVHDEGGLGKTIQGALDRAALEGRI